MMHAAYRMALAVALAIACVSHGCGPVTYLAALRDWQAPHEEVEK